MPSGAQLDQAPSGTRKEEKQAQSSETPNPDKPNDSTPPAVDNSAQIELDDQSDDGVEMTPPEIDFSTSIIFYRQYLTLKDTHPGLRDWPKLIAENTGSRASLLNRWWRGGTNDPESEFWSDLFLKSRNSKALTEEEMLALARNGVRKFRYPRVAQKLANDVKLKVNLSRTQACKLIARRELISAAKKYHIRNADLASILPYALELCFIATNDEQSALILASSSRAVDISHEMSRERKTGNHWLTRWLLGAPRKATEFTA